MSKQAAVAVARLLVMIHKWLAPLRRSVLLVAFGQVAECRHQPTCSSYLLEQVRQRGWRGFGAGLRRLLTCC